jgi:predicted aspartyl protease
MGITYVDAEVSNEAGISKTVRFLVDSGAIYSVLPEDVWRSLGLQPTRSLDFVLADGAVIQRNVSHCFVEFTNIRAPSPVLLGEGEDVALLGSVTLLSMGLVLNPFERALRPARLRLGTATPVRLPQPHSTVA